MARPVPISYTSCTFDTTAGTIFGKADVGMPTSAPAGALSFVGRLTAGAVNIRGDGTAPTSAEGEPLYLGDALYLSLPEFTRVQFIRSGSTNGVLKGHFYAVEASYFFGDNGGKVG